MDTDLDCDSQMFELVDINVASNKILPAPSAAVVDNIDDKADEEEDGELWSIDDDTLFQPCGLINHSEAAERCVFVTWNEYYLLNFRFKKNKKKMVRIPLPTLGRTYLRSIHMLEFNTLLLMSDGQVYCFGSIKSLHIIGWLSGVRCFARSQDCFSVIRHDEAAQRLLLEVYADLPSLSQGETTLRHSYNITYDEQNLFHSDWHQDQYTLQTRTVAAEEQQFLQKLFGNVRTGQQLHIFSVAGHVFALLPAEDSESESDYHIELLCVYASSVSFIRILPQHNLCLVYLCCGSVDMWHVSQLLGLKQRQMHHTGAQWLDYDASSDNGDFFYTDGEQLVRLQFQYVAQMDDCQVQRSVKAVPGMLACTWVRHTQQLVCLSDNNIFYRISFTASHTPAEDIGALQDLTSATLERLRKDSQLLAEYDQQPQRLQAALQRQQQQQQLVAVARQAKRHACDLAASLIFSRQLPNFGSDTLLLHTTRNVELHSSGIFALLQLELHSNKQLLHSSQWQVLVYHQGEAHVHYVPTELLLSRKCRVLIPLRHHNNKLLPEFELQLVAFLELHNEICAVLLPVKITESSETYSALFSPQLGALNLFNEPQVADMLPKAPGKETVQVMILQRIKASLEQIAAACNASGRSKDNSLELYFMSSKLCISASDEDSKLALTLTLESEDAAAIYYLKQQLLLNKDTLNAQDDNEGGVDAALKQQIMKFQCDIERLYGTQSRGGEGIETNVTIHLEALQRTYEKMRNIVF